MTEEEWLACADPIEMMIFLRGEPTTIKSRTWWNSIYPFEERVQGNDRKFLLFACACCRRIWDRIYETGHRGALQAIEDYLEGRLGPALEAALEVSSEVERKWRKDRFGTRSEPGYWILTYLSRYFYNMSPQASALLVASEVVFMADNEYGLKTEEEFRRSFHRQFGCFMKPFRWPSPIPATVEAERSTLAALLRDIVRNPFRPTTINPTWLTPTVTNLATVAYENRALPSGELDTTRLAILADALEESGCDNQDILSHLRSPGPHTRGCWPVDLCLGRS